MIYKHYKGGLYFMIGLVSPEDFARKLNPKESVSELVKATNESTLEHIDVELIYDKSMHRGYYRYNDKTDTNETFVLYRGLNNIHWLRPKSNFYSHVEVADEVTNVIHTVPRFERMNDEDLFLYISQLHKNERVT